MITPILYETHSHTTLCKHAVGTPEQYAVEAARKGLRGLTITCHNPMPDGFSAAVRMSPQELDEYVALVDRTALACRDTVDVKLGIEADFFQGFEPWLESQLASADFHFVLGSVHPQIPEFRDRYWSDDLLEIQKLYFRLLAEAAETGLFDSLAHPDLIKNFTAKEWQPECLMDDICDALDRIAKTGIAMEINTSGLHKTIREMNPFPAMLVEMRKRNIPITVGSDAHEPGRVCADHPQAYDILEAAGYDTIRHYIDRQPVSIKITDARASLATLATS